MRGRGGGREAATRCQVFAVRSLVLFVRSFAVDHRISQSVSHASEQRARKATVETRLFIADDTSFLPMSFRASASSLLSSALCSLQFVLRIITQGQRLLAIDNSILTSDNLFIH